MKRFIVCVFLIILCFLFQTTVFKGIALGGIVPNLMIILTASFGFMRGEKTGLIMGFFCGLLADIKLPLALILVSDLAYGFLYYITLFLMRSRFHIEYYFLHIILPEVVYTILITLLLYPLVLWLNKKLEESEKRSARKFV